MHALTAPAIDKIDGGLGRFILAEKVLGNELGDRVDRRVDRKESDWMRRELRFGHRHVVRMADTAGANKRLSGRRSRAQRAADERRSVPRDYLGART